MSYITRIIMYILIGITSTKDTWKFNFVFFLSRVHVCQTDWKCRLKHIIRINLLTWEKKFTIDENFFVGILELIIAK